MFGLVGEGGREAELELEGELGHGGSRLRGGGGRRTGTELTFRMDTWVG